MLNMQNTIVCNFNGICTNGSIMIVTLFPCCDCCRALIQSGVKVLVTEKPDLENPRWGNDFKISEILLQEGKIEVLFI